jgi:hypothetical protein
MADTSTFIPETTEGTTGWTGARELSSSELSLNKSIGELGPAPFPNGEGVADITVFQNSCKGETGLGNVDAEAEADPNCSDNNFALFG